MVAGLLLAVTPMIMICRHCSNAARCCAIWTKKNSRLLYRICASRPSGPPRYVLAHSRPWRPSDNDMQTLFKCCQVLCIWLKTTHDFFCGVCRESALRAPALCPSHSRPWRPNDNDMQTLFKCCRCCAIWQNNSRLLFRMCRESPSGPPRYVLAHSRPWRPPDPASRGTIYEALPLILEWFGVFR